MSTGTKVAFLERERVGGFAVPQKLGLLHMFVPQDAQLGHPMPRQATPHLSHRSVFFFNSRLCASLTGLVAPSAYLERGPPGMTG